MLLLNWYFTIKRARLELKCRVNLPLVFFAVGILSMKQYINKRKMAWHIYIPVFLSRKWLYHMIAFPFSGLMTRLLLWQFWARLHFQPSPFSQACQKSNRQLSTAEWWWLKLPNSCSETRLGVRSIMPNRPLRDHQWEYSSKTELHFLIKPGQPRGMEEK